MTGANNQLLSDGEFSYEYDHEGNRAAKQRISSDPADDFRVEYGWDYRQRLTQVTFKRNDGTVTKQVGYEYDAFDRLVARSVDLDGALGSAAVTKTFMVHDDDDVILDFVDVDAASADDAVLDNRYLHGPMVDQVLAEQDAGTGDIAYYLADHLGSVRDVIDNSGDVVNHVRYDAFGNVVDESDPAYATRYKYTGREFDPDTGLQYNRARWYDPKIGRWISEDPIEFEGDSTNLYVYVLNSPINWIDPSGEKIYLGKGQGGRWDPVGVIHQDIAVDKWKKKVDGCGNVIWEKDGVESFSFGVSDKKKVYFPKQNDWLGWTDLAAVGIFGLHAGQFMTGEIYSSTFDPKLVVSTIDTTPEQDMEWLKYMRGRLGTTDRYSVLWWNCVNYTNHEFGAAKGKYGK